MAHLSNDQQLKDKGVTASTANLVTHDIVQQPTHWSLATPATNAR